MELLRITAMLMIIAYHIFGHCINVQLTDTSSIAELGNSWYCHPWFSRKLCAVAVVSPMGQAGNAIFIIISGYFMAHKGSIDLTKISKKLLMQLGFAAAVLGFASIYAYHNVTEFPVKLVQFKAFNSMSWYVGYYFIVIVIAKVFLNGFLGRLERKNYVMFLMVLFALMQFSWSARLIANLGEGLERVLTGIFLYSLGGYVKKYDPFGRVRSWAIIAVIVLINLIVIGNFYISTAANILEYDPNSGDMFIQSIPKYSNNQIVPVVLGIAAFELFRRIKVPNNRIINFVGASTFMVYLIHDNAFVHSIWKARDWLTLLYENTTEFFAAYFMCVLKTFAVGLVCYCLFIIGGKLLKRCKPLAIKKSVKKSVQISDKF